MKGINRPDILMRIIGEFYKFARFFPLGQLTQCERDRITALKIVDSRRKEGETVFGFYIPTCDSGGDFDEVQCLSSNEKCWCVDRKSGKKVDGVAIPGNPICVKC